MKLTEGTRMEQSSVEFMSGEALSGPIQKQMACPSPCVLEGENANPPVNKHLTNGHNGAIHNSSNTFENGQTEDQDGALGIEVESYGHVDSLGTLHENGDVNTEERSKNSDHNNIQCYIKSYSVCDKNSLEKRSSPNLSLHSDEFHLNLSEDDDDNDQIQENCTEAISNIDLACSFNEENERSLPASSGLESPSEGSGAKEDTTLVSNFNSDPEPTNTLKSDTPGSDQFQAIVVDDTNVKIKDDKIEGPSVTDQGVISGININFVKSEEDDENMQLGLRQRFSLAPDVDPLTSKELKHDTDVNKHFFESSGVYDIKSFKAREQQERTCSNEPDLLVSGRVALVENKTTVRQDEENEKIEPEVCTTYKTFDGLIEERKVIQNSEVKDGAQEKPEEFSDKVYLKTNSCTLEAEIKTVLLANTERKSENLSEDSCENRATDASKKYSETKICAAIHFSDNALKHKNETQTENTAAQDVEGGDKETSTGFVETENLEKTNSDDILSEKRELDMCSNGNSEEQELPVCPVDQCVSEVLQNEEFSETRDDKHNLNSEVKEESTTGSVDRTVIIPMLSDSRSQEELKSESGNKSLDVVKNTVQVGNETYSSEFKCPNGCDGDNVNEEHIINVDKDFPVEEALPTSPKSESCFVKINTCTEEDSSKEACSNSYNSLCTEKHLYSDLQLVASESLGNGKTVGSSSPHMSKDDGITSVQEGEQHEDSIHRFDEDEGTNSTSCSDETTSSGRKQDESDSEVVNDKGMEDESCMDEITVEEMAGLDGESNPSNHALSDSAKLVLHEFSSSEMDCHASNNSPEDIERNCRKRTLSQSDDVLDTSKRKVNGSLEGDLSFESSKDFLEKRSEIGQKRSGECVEEVEAKKIRVKTGFKSENVKEAHLDTISDLNLVQKAEIDENDRLRKLQKAANLDSLLSKPTQIQETDLDRSITKIIAKGPTQPVNLPFLSNLYKGQIEKMKRSDLEELVVQKICEAIAYESIAGELRLRCQALEKGQEKEKEKFASLKKQMQELNMVMKRFIDSSQRVGVPNTLVKVTRSVGLQVCQGTKSMGLGGCRPRSAPVHSPCRVHPLLTAPISKQGVFPAACPDSSSAKTPKSPQATVTHVQHTPPGLESRIMRPTPAPNPPALVPTSSPTAVLVTVPASTPTVTSRNDTTPPRLHSSIPPLRQISNNRPKPSAPSTPINSGIVQMQNRQPPPLQVKQTPLQTPNLLRQPTPTKDVEVIDVIDKEDTNIKSGSRTSQHQHQHQQKQAANAAAQNLASNSGMTVRLISPQVSQPGVTYHQLLVPSQGMQQKMIITSASQAAPLRGNVKTIIMKNGSQGNLLIPIQQGVAVSSNVVHMPAQTTQQAVQQIFTNAGAGGRTTTVATLKSPLPSHPAPLPAGPTMQASNPLWKMVPPRPNLKIQHQNNGIVLSWNMVLGPIYAEIASYQLYAYQEGSAPPSPNLWKKVGDVKALPLPMACTLTQFVAGHRYHFTVRAVDVHGRVGPFSLQGSIRLGN